MQAELNALDKETNGEESKAEPTQKTEEEISAAKIDKIEVEMLTKEDAEALREANKKDKEPVDLAVR